MQQPSKQLVEEVDNVSLSTVTTVCVNKIVQDEQQPSKQLVEETHGVPPPTAPIVSANETVQASASSSSTSVIEAGQSSGTPLQSAAIMDYSTMLESEVTGSSSQSEARSHQLQADEGQKQNQDQTVPSS